MTDQRTTRRHIPALDGLRGLAVAGVLLFHDGRLTGGFLGVDLFFGLSGFLITSILIDERVRTGALRLMGFWEKRARRLLPAVLVFLLAMVPLMALFGSASQQVSVREGLWPALFYVANWHQIGSSADYWALFRDPSPLTHLWSLAVEEQFYLVWPLVAFWCMKRSNWRTWLIGVAGLGCVVSVGLMVVLYEPSDPSRVYMGSDTRAFSILVGVLAALIGLSSWATTVARRRPRVVEATQAVLLGAVLWSWWNIDGSSSDWLYRGGLALHSSVCVVLAASVDLERPNRVLRALAVRPLRWLGIISYGLYLWHWPVFIILDPDRTGLGAAPLTVLRWAVSLGVATLSYRLIEAPIRYRRALRSLRAGLGSIAVAVAALVAIVVIVPGPDSSIAAVDVSSIVLPTTSTGNPATPSSEPSDEAVTQPTTVVDPSVTTTLATDVSTATPTVAPVPTMPPIERRTISSVVFEGDSVAFDSAPGVNAALTAAGLASTDRAYPGFGVLSTERSDPIDLFVTSTVDVSPDVVMYMTSVWDSEKTPQEQRQGFANYADAVADLGATLIVLEPPPVDSTRYEQDHTAMMALARERAVTHPGTVIVLDSSLLWGSFADDLNGDGIPERKPDGVHVCPSGAAMLGNWLAYQLAEYFDGVTPADPATWAGLGWIEDPRYNDPIGACATR